MNAEENRREFFRDGLAIGAGALAAGAGPAAALAAAAPPAKAKARMHLGLVTYMIGARMDLKTLIKTCEQTGMEGVELRSTH